jgi:hypothetical protein
VAPPNQRKLCQTPFTHSCSFYSIVFALPNLPTTTTLIRRKTTLRILPPKTLTQKQKRIRNHRSSAYGLPIPLPWAVLFLRLHHVSKHNTSHGRRVHAHEQTPTRLAWKQASAAGPTGARGKRKHAAHFLHSRNRFRNTKQGIARFKISLMQINPIVEIPLVTVAVLFLSLALILLAKKVPVLRTLVG